MKNKNYLKIIGFSVSTFMGICYYVPARSQAHEQLDINNVDARFYSQGTMFHDLINGTSQYEVPKGSGKGTIYAGGLWIGGLDGAGQIHLAAETYRQSGGDYWPGPLNIVTGAAANPQQWDYVWKVDKSEIDNHILNWNNGAYITPTSIANWPGNSAPGSGFSPILAPFVDINANQLYEPALGEYPAIEGDRALYFIFNDNYGTHTETGCNALQVEVHGMAYAFDRPNDPYLNNTIFVDYEIGNRSDSTYNSVSIGLWTDFDIGNYLDDYVGTDVIHNMYYGYNGDSIDDGPMGYGVNPPAQGVTFLNQTLHQTICYENINNSPYGNPNGCNDFYSYLRSTWLDNKPLTYGADGQSPTNPLCNYMYPGNTDSALFASNGAWSEVTAGNPPGDRRMLGSVYFPQLPAGGYVDILVAYTFAQAASGGPDSSVALLEDYVGQLRNDYNNGTLSINENNHHANGQIIISPNPANDFVNVKFNNPAKDSFTLCVYDIAGKKVQERKNIRDQKFMILRGCLSPGMYIVKLQSEKNSFTAKVIFK